MKKNEYKPNINELLDKLKETFKHLEPGQTVEISLHSEYEPCEYDCTFNTFSLWVTEPYGWHFMLDPIKEIIELLFDWDYKISAKFDVVISRDSFDIVFHEPVISYKSTTKMFSLKEE
jgi:hypothetical protein